MDKKSFEQKFQLELAKWKMIDGWFSSRATSAQLKIMAAEYSDALFGVMSHSLLEQSFLIAKRENKTVPSIKGFIDADEKSKLSPIKKNHTKIPEFSEREITAEEITINQQRFRINMDVALRKITYREGEELLRELLAKKNG